MEFLEPRLVIETLQMRRPAGHAEVNDAPGFDGKMRWIDHALPTSLVGRGLGSVKPFGIEQAGQRQTAQAVGRAAQKGAAIDVQLEFLRIEVGIHTDQIPNSKIQTPGKL